MFSRECRLTDIHNPIQAKSGNTKWTPEFLPVMEPEWCFMESLLWVFYFSGMCCAIVGDFVTYLVVKFAHSLDNKYVIFTLQKNTCRSDTILWRVLWNWSQTFCVGAFHIELHPVCTLCKYLMSAVSHTDVSVILKIYCIDTSNPCCPPSKCNFIHLEFVCILFYELCYSCGTVLYFR